MTGFAVERRFATRAPPYALAAVLPDFRICRARANSLATSATATAGRSSDFSRAPSSTRFAAADSDIAPRFALDDFSECAASRNAL